MKTRYSGFRVRFGICVHFWLFFTPVQGFTKKERPLQSKSCSSSHNEKYISGYFITSFNDPRDLKVIIGSFNNNLVLKNNYGRKGAAEAVGNIIIANHAWACRNSSRISSWWLLQRNQLAASMIFFLNFNTLAHDAAVLPTGASANLLSYFPFISKILI